MTQKLNSSMKTMKFVYSYGGKIGPRPVDGKLRYSGGHTRVLAVDRSITYSELMVKFSESCGSSMDLKCKLPKEDLDLLVTIKSDEELRHLVEEYERDAPEAKIRAVLFPSGSAKKVSSPSSPMSSFDFPSAAKATPPPAANIRAVRFPFRSAKKASPPSSPMSCFDFPSAAKAPPRAAVYCAAPPAANIRAAHFPIRSAKKVSPPSSPMSCFDFPSAAKPPRSAAPPPPAAVYRAAPAVGYPVIAGKMCYCPLAHFYHVPHRNHS